MVDTPVRGAEASPQPWTVRGSGGARNESVRRHNLSTVLSAVHYSRAVSRAALTRETGLNRSTIGAVVSTLEEAGLVTSDEPSAERSVGRPSPVISPAPTVCALAINPDIDAIRVALVSLGGEVLAEASESFASVPSPPDAAATAARLAASIVGERASGLVGAGVAVPGLVAFEGGTVVNAPHLGWRDEAIAEPWSSALGMPVYVGNDANVALLAEVRFGAAMGASDVLYLNGSTSGIGGAALVGGRLMTGARGHGGEFGHMAVASGTRRCDCGRTGCLETEVNVQRLAGLEGAARQAEVERQAGVLAGAIANLISAFNPQLVVVGGFLAELIDDQSELVLGRVAEQTLPPLADGVPIVRAGLGDAVLALGAAELAFAPLLADPVPARV
ncbi:ROK family transcriptional regulator [Demequina sp.]|uniref:ROK family transcriptional regulator n=1 Tax=Demequina sp. TaxID=2050685 RepID=UPI003D0A6301